MIFIHRHRACDVVWIWWGWFPAFCRINSYLRTIRAKEEAFLCSLLFLETMSNPTHASYYPLYAHWYWRWRRFAPNSAFFFFLFPLALEEHSLSSPEEEATKAGWLIDYLIGLGSIGSVSSSISGSIVDSMGKSRKGVFSNMTHSHDTCLVIRLEIPHPSLLFSTRNSHLRTQNYLDCQEVTSHPISCTGEGRIP